ncbi:MAG: thiamine-phosphate kinase [Desulfobacterales bacterium]|nr:thiamine-phosphate kinase [Desulfobacterales bacterium]
MSETLSQIGEFGLISRIHELIQAEGVQTPGLTLGIGDDCACFRPRPGYELLITCDCIVEGRHYLPDYIGPLDLGRRAMTVNISDIGAMGGRPLYAVVSLGLTRDTSVTYVEDMYRGFLAELKPLRASIIGGNVSMSGHGMFVDITLVGEVKKDKILCRSSAKPGDAILVTGYPGRAAAGLRLLLQDRPLEDINAHPLVRAYNSPSHRALEGQAVANSGYATAMIDISDGLLGDLGHICQESRVGAVLVQENLPLNRDLQQAALELGLGSYDLVMQQSDDYELIITCPAGNVDKLRSVIAASSDVHVSEIGRISKTPGCMELVCPDGTQHAIIPDGWDHFLSGKKGNR